MIDTKIPKDILKKIDKRWFYIVEKTGKRFFFSSVLVTIIFSLNLLHALVSSLQVMWVETTLYFYWTYLISYIIVGYIFCKLLIINSLSTWKSFYGNNWVMLNPLKTLKERWLSLSMRIEKNWANSIKGVLGILGMLWIPIGLLGFMYKIHYDILLPYNFQDKLLILDIIFVIFFLALSILITFWIHTFHPLYAFWNLWEKIQNITPEIQKQSRFIQKNFKINQNFHILRNWFDSLSSTFSKTISLVIRLERVEKKANKWNLFDSEKYIGSLRSDIIEPLKSLRLFLEEQRQKLIESQGELEKVRVRVGADPSLRSGWQEQGAMQKEVLLWSKRSESLIQELDENISKLDVMIGKMGE